MESNDLVYRLPHRPPFLFITRVNHVDATSAQAIWAVDGSEWFFSGHFPGRPMVPGVLLTEALAQVAGLIAARAAGAGDAVPSVPPEGKLAMIDVRFYETAIPPAEIVLEVKLERNVGRLYQFDVAAFVAGGKIAGGSLSLAIEPIKSEAARPKP